MRGYLSFLLVLSIMLCVFSFMQILPSLNSVSEYKAIEAERTNSLSMNIKETILLSTSYWLRTSALLYDSLPEAEKNPEERELAIKAGILAGWAILSNHPFSEDFEVELWCGQINYNIKEQLSEEMLAQGKVLSCSGCSPLSSIECANYIQVSQKASDTETDKVSLKAGNMGVVGASIYSKKYGTANVLYIPPTQVIE